MGRPDRRVGADVRRVGDDRVIHRRGTDGVAEPTTRPTSGHGLSPNLLSLDDRFPLPLDAPFTRTQALRAGLTDRRLRTLVGRGFLRRPVLGVYVAAHLPDSLALRTEVLRLVLPPGCFACDETAAWLHGADMALAPNSHLALPRVSFFRPADEGRLRNPLATSGERTVTPRDLTDVGGLLVTTPLRTALDLGRLRHRDQALAALDAFLHLGLVTREELLDSPRPLRGAAGRRPAALARLDRRRARRVGRRVGAAAALVRRGPATAAAADLHPPQRRRGVPARPGPRGAAVRRGVRRGRLPHVQAAARTRRRPPCRAPRAAALGPRGLRPHQRVRAAAGRRHPAAKRLPGGPVEPG